MAGAGAALVVVIFFFAIFMLGGIRVLNEYERAVVFRLGRLTPVSRPRRHLHHPDSGKDGARSICAP